MDNLFLTVLNMSLTGAFVAAAICLARLPLKKAPKVISYCLWAVAGFRLIFPFSIESAFSLIPFNAQIIPRDIAAQTMPRIDSGVRFVNDAIGGILPAAAPGASVNPLQIWVSAGAYVWVTGTVIMLIYGIISYILLKRRMRTAIRLDGNIFGADSIQSPFVLGIVNPKIYLPLSLAAREGDYIILHEQTHIRRHDHIIKFVAYFILCLHWFNPLVWLAFFLMGVDMEMSCDERVLKELGGEIKKDYSRSLLSLATERRIIAGGPLAFGEGGIKERVSNVLNFKKQSRIIVVLAVALMALLSVGFAVSRSGEEKSPLQEITGATQEQAELIESKLAECGITYQTILNSVNPITEDMGADWQAYDLLAADDGESYVLILRKADHDFTAVLNHEGELISGTIDNGLTPALFPIETPALYPEREVFEGGSMEEQGGILIEEDRVIYVDGRKAVHMTFVGYDAWVAAGAVDSNVYDYAECVIYTPIGTNEQTYMRIDDYKAWTAAGEADVDIHDFAVPFDGQ